GVPVVAEELVKPVTLAAHRWQIKHSQYLAAMREVEFVDGLIKYELAIDMHLNVVHASMEATSRRQAIFRQDLNTDIAMGEDRYVKHVVIAYAARVKLKTSKPVIDP